MAWRRAVHAVVPEDLLLEGGVAGSGVLNPPGTGLHWPSGQEPPGKSDAEKQAITVHAGDDGHTADAVKKLI